MLFSHPEVLGLGYSCWSDAQRSQESISVNPSRKALALQHAVTMSAAPTMVFCVLETVAFCMAKDLWNWLQEMYAM